MYICKKFVYKDDNMNTRLQQFITAENITQSQFADSINVARASISHILSGRNKPGFDFISNLMEAYPALNIEWLITGKGKMYRGSSGQPVPSAENQPQTEVHAEGKPSTRVPFEDDDDLLFHDDETVQAPKTAAPETGNVIPVAPAQPQPVQKVRKAARVIVFYDDNTFQELANNIAL